MKYIILIFFLILSLRVVYTIHAQADPLENPKVPYMTDGLGNGENPGTKKKTSHEIFEDFLNIFFKPPNKSSESDKTTIPTAPTSIPTPLNSLTPFPTIESVTIQPSITNILPTSFTGSDTTVPNTAQIKGCPPGNTKIHLAGIRYQHLMQQFDCHPPRMFVIHWSAGWSSAQATFNVLNQRQRSCQIAIDDTETIQMLDFYTDEVQLGWCVGGENNVGSISYEITGAYFDDVLKNPNTNNYKRLMKMTDTAVALTCKLSAKYNIPKTAIYGHYELQAGKQDPGPEYLEYFKNRVNNEC